MIIKREIKGGNYKYWKILMKRRGLENEMKICVYGFYNGKVPKLGWDNKLLIYIGTSVEDVISKERELIQLYYLSMKEQINRENEYLDDYIKEITKEFNQQIAEIKLERQQGLNDLKVHFDDPTIISIMREEKLNRIIKDEDR